MKSRGGKPTLTNNYGGKKVVQYLYSSALVKRYVWEDCITRYAHHQRGNGRANFVYVSFDVRRSSPRCGQEAKGKGTFRGVVPRSEAGLRDGLDPLSDSAALGAGVLGFIPDIIERTELKSSDALHLASALWIRDVFRLRSRYGPKGSKVTFVTADRFLAKEASASTFDVLNLQRKPSA